MTSILTTLVYPLVPWLMQLTVVVFYATLTLYVASMGTSEYRVSVMPDSCLETCKLFKVRSARHQKLCTCIVQSFLSHIIVKLAPKICGANIICVQT